MDTTATAPPPNTTEMEIEIAKLTPKGRNVVASAGVKVDDPPARHVGQEEGMNPMRHLPPRDYQQRHWRS